MTEERMEAERAVFLTGGFVLALGSVWANLWFALAMGAFYVLVSVGSVAYAMGVSRARDPLPAKEEA